MPIWGQILLVLFSSIFLSTIFVVLTYKFFLPLSTIISTFAKNFLNKKVNIKQDILESFYFKNNKNRKIFVSLTIVSMLITFLLVFLPIFVSLNNYIYLPLIIVFLSCSTIFAFVYYAFSYATVRLQEWIESNKGYEEEFTFYNKAYEYQIDFFDFDLKSAKYMVVESNNLLPALKVKHFISFKKLKKIYKKTLHIQLLENECYLYSLINTDHCFIKKTKVKNIQYFALLQDFIEKFKKVRAFLNLN